MFRPERLRLILGGPGCGKTTRLIAIVSEHLERGIAPGEIAFVAFTRAAADDARAKAAERFGLDPKTDLPWFRTIHSLAFTTLGIGHDEVMNGKDWREFGKLIREPMKGIYTTDVALIPGTIEGGRNLGDTMLRIVDYAATTCLSLVEVWHTMDEPVDWFRLKHFSDSLERYKSEIGKVDFADMLRMYPIHNQPLNVKIAIIDEAQDLTQAQWRVVEHAFKNAERIYIGGDDDQAIYRWAGADVEHFLGLEAEREILPHSHRLCPDVFTLAQQIVRRIGHRFEKNYRPDEHAGSVRFLRDSREIDLGEGSWLLLARNGYMLAEYEHLCEALGVPYRTRAGESVNPEHVKSIQLWERLRTRRVESADAQSIRGLAKLLDESKPTLKETQQYGCADFPDWKWNQIWNVAFTGIPHRLRDYYVACLRRGEKLTRASRIRIDTIHGVKGAEADHVLLRSDISSRTAESFLKGPDHEHRVFYVGLTRARTSLHIIEPQTGQAYAI